MRIVSKGRILFFILDQVRTVEHCGPNADRLGGTTLVIEMLKFKSLRLTDALLARVCAKLS
jgi:hypothetical protein